MKRKQKREGREAKRERRKLTEEKDEEDGNGIQSVGLQSAGRKKRVIRSLKIVADISAEDQSA